MSWYDSLLHYYQKEKDRKLWDLELMAVLNGSVCMLSDDSYHHADSIYGAELGQDDKGFYALIDCKYCGHEFKYYSADLQRQYDDYVSTLPPGLDASNNGVVAYGSGFFLDSSDNELSNAFWAGVDVYSLFNSGDDGYLLLLRQWYSTAKNYYYWLGRDASSNCLYFWRSTSLGDMYDSSNWPLGELTIQTQTDLTSGWAGGTTYCYVYPNYYSAMDAYTNGQAYTYFLTPESRIQILSQTSSSYYGPISISELGYVSSSGVTYGYTKNCYYSYSSKYSYAGYAYGLYPRSYDVSSDYGTDTRPVSIMQTINNYNIDNSVTNNVTNVNYYIGTVDESNNVTNIYNINIYDEETMVFTEPVSGVQYQTTGWTYNYTNRSYNIDIEPGTLTYDSTDIDNIIICYGDEELGIFFHNGDTLVGVDTYSYVAVSGSECSLYGHTNTVETIDPTCTSGGQIKSTCSVCGHEEVTVTDPIGHTFNYSVLREASCDAAGLGLYTCSVCGTEYTESIAALAHSYQLKETVDATYDEDGNKLSSAYTVYSCSVCGNEYLDYTGDGVVTDDSGNWSWLKKWLTEFKEWLGDLIGGISVDSGDTIYNDYQNSIDITGDTNPDYDITYEDQNGEQQKTSIKDIINKFAFIEDLYAVGDTLITAVTSDAAVAYELDNTTSESDYSIMTDGVPTLTVNLGAAESKYGYNYGGQVAILDLSWYTPYKETVDNLLSGFLWLMFLWRLFKSGPSILGGASLTTEAAELYRDRQPALPKGGKKH